MAEFTVKKGRHFSTPFCTKRHRKVKEVWFRVRFDESCLYDHGTVDNKDWNKLKSLRYYFWNSKKNTQFAVWRISEDLKRIELSAYYHDNWDTIMRGAMITVDVNQDVLVGLINDGDRYRVAFKYSDEYVFDEFIFSHGHKNAWEGQHYFGGNMPAPHDIKIKIERL